MKKNLSIVASILLISFVITSCSKDGADGAPGPAGLAGAQGSTGADGNDGTSNMSSSIFIADTWYWSNSYEGAISIYSTSAISQEVVDSGMVMVYTNNIFGSNINYPLPYSPFTVSDYSEVITFSYSLNQVVIVWRNSNYDDQVVPGPGAGFEFRVVVITPSMLAANPGADWNNYGEVEKLLNQ